jgi:predicted secreted hydrolase
MTGRPGVLLVVALVAFVAGSTNVHTTDHECQQLTKAPVFTFPQDFAVHVEYKKELWWYLGHAWSVKDPSRRFGIDLSVYRDDISNCTAAWDGYFSVDLAIADVSNNRFLCNGVIELGVFADIKFSDPQSLFSIEQVNKWKAWQTKEGNLKDFGLWFAGADSNTKTTLGVNLTLHDLIGTTLMAVDGFEADRPEGGEAHIEQTWFNGTGTVLVQDEEVEVYGQFFLQHIWHSLGDSGWAGWNWFYMQLDNGWTMSCTRFSADEDPNSYCNVIRPRDKPMNSYINAKQYTLTSGRPWTSDYYNTTFYTQHNITIPSFKMVVSFQTLLDDNVIHLQNTTTVLYYEGASDVSATIDGWTHTGVGYTEHVPPSSTALGSGRRAFRPHSFPRSFGH